LIELGRMKPAVSFIVASALVVDVAASAAVSELVA
jgi:hypothetical protein